MSTTNPREAIGGNQTPDYAKIEGLRLNDEYQGFKNTLEELKAGHILGRVVLDFETVSANA